MKKKQKLPRGRPPVDPLYVKRVFTVRLPQWMIDIVHRSGRNQSEMVENSLIETENWEPPTVKSDGY